MKHFIFSVSFYTILSFLIFSCATVISPTGGPKDTEPPKIKNSSLDDCKTSFHKNIIKISFNEFFTLDNPTETVIFSPPLKEFPDISVKNKNLIIKFKDSLRINTTYSIIFSNALKDFTEGNVLPYLSYVFSTGSYMDSLSFCGDIKNAQTDQPEADIYVFLYQNIADSVLKTEKPYYVTKTDKKGHFVFSFLKAGQYKIAALKDKNNNLLYDLPEEMIAFQEELIEPYYIPIDSSLIDSSKKIIQNNLISLRLFKEKDSLQNFIKYTNPASGIYKLQYRNTVNKLKINILDGIFPDYFLQYNTQRDSLIFFLKKDLKDTVSAELIVDDKQIDTIEFKPFKQHSRQKNKPILNVNLEQGKYGFDPLQLSFSYPIQPNQIDYILKQYNQEDTLITPLHLSIPDTLTTKITLPLKLKENTTYELFFKDSIFHGYNHLNNDSLTFKLTTKKESDFGSLNLFFKLPNEHQYIVQLLSNHKIIAQDILIPFQKSIHFSLLNPGNYQILLIKDSNQNGQWDTGNYDRKIQAEATYLYTKTITIRAGWDLEETLKPF